MGRLRRADNMEFLEAITAIFKAGNEIEHAREQALR
jgi:hypothetical protein